MAKETQKSDEIRQCALAAVAREETTPDWTASCAAMQSLQKAALVAASRGAKIALGG
jgi:hypothetical protein